VQVTPLARPVTRGVFGARPVPSAVPISMPASGAPDADRWAAPRRCHTILVVSLSQSRERYECGQWLRIFPYCGKTW